MELLVMTSKNFCQAQVSRNLNNNSLPLQPLKMSLNSSRSILPIRQVISMFNQEVKFLNNSSYSQPREVAHAAASIRRPQGVSKPVHVEEVPMGRMPRQLAVDTLPECRISNRRLQEIANNKGLAIVVSLLLDILGIDR